MASPIRHREPQARAGDRRGRRAACCGRVLGRSTGPGTVCTSPRRRRSRWTQPGS